MREALAKHKDELFSRVHEEMTKALETRPDYAQAVLLDGRALAYMKQDDAAKAQFQRFVALRPEGDPERQRALRFISQPELVRARMAPPFAVNTLDGRHVSLDDLQGKVVLLDFWATWCVPCQRALPHLRKIAKNFEGQPLVVLSISLDNDEDEWKTFVQKNGMTWLQYRDGGFEGPIARMFGVNAIPHTFTIDPDGVLQDEQIGDASIEGKLKKLVARAREMQVSEKQAQ
jgi:thiol-disulfide isomerase/thioredoxin